MTRSDRVAEVLGTFRLHRHLEMGALMERVHDPLARAFGRRRISDATLDFIGRQIAADREARQRQLRARLAGTPPAEEV